MTTIRDRVQAALSGHYDIEAERGRGGMATVFRARDVKHDRTVAVKVLDPELGEALGAERFLREVRITARLNHPHILPLLDSGEAGGLLYYVMPFVEGESLRERLAREGELPVDEALRLTREVAEALGAAHGLGIAHRDIKPENILLQGGHALVADFGIAKAFDAAAPRLTGTGIAVGTPLYMSPEQAHGSTVVDGRSDLYSLACVAYEMLTGEAPFTGPTAMAVTSRKLTETPPPLRTRRATVSASAEAAIARALARSPADRFRTTHEFVEALGASAGSSHGGSAPAGSGAAPGAGGRVLRASLAAAAALAVVALVVWGPRLLSRSAAGEESSIAVLPFDNLSPDSSQAYFAEGLADELVTSLSMVEGIRVASRTSTSALLRQGMDLQGIGERLNVGTVLEGSLRMGGGRVRVATRLVRVAGGAAVWSQTYDRDAADVLVIQEEVAAAIANALRGELVPENLAAVSSGTDDPEAYDLYLQARAQRLRQTEEALRAAERTYRDVIARSPGFARAHAGLAELLAVQGWYDYQPPREAFPAAQRAAAEALRLDPRNASAQSTIAYAVLYYEWDLPRAEREFRRAIDLDPNSAIAHQWYGNYLTVAQRWEEAEAEFRTALLLEPTAPVRHAVQCWVLTYRGDHQRAYEAYRRATAVDSTYSNTYQWGAVAIEGLGRLDEAVAAQERAVALTDSAPGALASLARLRAIRGDGAAARALLGRVLSARIVPAFEVAKVHLALGDRREAMRWLERAYEERAHSMLFLRIDPHLAPLRGDPAFEALARKVGI